MFPIKDDNPTETKPYITCILISLHILIFDNVILYFQVVKIKITF